MKKYSFLSFITPRNISTEEEQFFQSSSYNPRFVYDWDQEKIAAYNTQKPKYTRLIQAVVQQDIPTIIAEAQKQFETVIDKTVLHEAQRIVATHTTPALGSTPEQMATAFRNALSFLELPYEVVISEKSGYSFRPVHGRSKLFVSRHANLDFITTDGAVKHELTHILRYVNSRANGYEYADNYLPTEEGLACYMQDYQGKGGDTALFQHAAQYVATSIGLNSSFRDIYNYFRTIGFSEKMAWQKSVRHKFGFVDTAQPGVIMKPGMYFYHEQKITRLTEDERWKLFVGKISVDMLPKIPAYSGVVPLTHLKEFYNRSW